MFVRFICVDNDAVVYSFLMLCFLLNEFSIFKSPRQLTFIFVDVSWRMYAIQAFLKLYGKDWLAQDFL